MLTRWSAGWLSWCIILVFRLASMAAAIMVLLNKCTYLPASRGK